ncbi:uncharacterized protein [Solanum lycopersicum]|uniref:uncharacterized protein n=1 Tax=Solanum lycopersicum TaxID=4081 RepID=UPI00374791EB
MAEEDIQNFSSQTPRIFRNIMDKKAKAVAELQVVKKEAQEVYAKFVKNQDTLEKTTQEVERLRRGYEDFDTLVKEKIERMRYESLEEKGRLGEGFLLMLRYMFQQYKTQGDGDGARPSGEAMSDQNFLSLKFDHLGRQRITAIKRDKNIHMELTEEELQRKIKHINREIQEAKEEGLRVDMDNTIYKVVTASLDEDLASQMKRKKNFDAEIEDLREKLDMVQLKVQEREARELRIES